MKEHPDYKYRPRRKPKTLAKPPSGNQSNGSHHHNGLSNSAQTNHNHSSSNNNNNDSRNSNNNHHHHHHSMKAASPIISSHLHHSHHHATGKYPFVPTIELPISFPSSQHSQQQGFPAGIHYPLLDPTLALDLQARLQAMYGAYYPWRFGCNPLISSSSSPPQSGNIYATSPKISPTTTTNSPPLEPDTQTSII